MGAPYYRSVLGEDTDTSRTAGGAVYIFYNYGDGAVQSSKSILTPGACRPGIGVKACNNAQFGYSISSLGDINGDGLEGL